jgi:hypothetical protein
VAKNGEFFSPKVNPRPIGMTQKKTTKEKKLLPGFFIAMNTKNEKTIRGGSQFNDMFLDFFPHK